MLLKKQPLIRRGNICNDAISYVNKFVLLLATFPRICKMILRIKMSVQEKHKSQSNVNLT